MRGERLDRSEILPIFSLLDEGLAASEATRDVGVLFRATLEMREAARRGGGADGPPRLVAERCEEGLPEHARRFRAVPRSRHLKVFVARPGYLLAMKCAAMRLGAEFHDLDDIRFPLRALDLHTVEEALAVEMRYFDEASLPAKTSTRPACRRRRGLRWKSLSSAMRADR